MKQEIFKTGWATLLNAFPNNNNTPETQKIYWQMLVTLYDEAFEDAIRICLNECKFFPTIAELREAGSRRSFDTGALDQMRLDPPMPKGQAQKTLRDMIARLPDPVFRNDKPFQQKNLGAARVRCIRCGTLCLLPYSDGIDRLVICEPCNEREK